MDPDIITINLGAFQLTLRWYGLIIAGAVFLGTIITERQIKQRGGRADFIWDAMLLVLPVAIVGSRAWYVINDIVGGGSRYIEDPLSILSIPSGGLHIYGALFFGGVVAFLYARRKNIDFWLILDSVAPALLIAQAVGRLGNYINQELYGPPTTLPWGIPIDAVHRIHPWNDLIMYPEATTRFHPTFAYQIIFNLAAAAFLIWLGRRYQDQLRPGAIFAIWLMLAGGGRFVLEWFRPDQPVIPGTVVSYSRIVAGLMFLAGLFILLIKYSVIRLSFISPGPANYQGVRTRGSRRKARKS
jgi:phosphatidylglycerol:prolipoprotein diacylglycerol transferase